MVAAANDELSAQLEAKGMQFNEVDKAAFIAAVEPIWESQKDVYGEELTGEADAAFDLIQPFPVDDMVIHQSGESLKSDRGVL